MPGKRKYRKKKRAEQELETRRRIVDALVELHGTVGPSRTTVSEVSERAGVQRATVYRHFPDEASMFAACSAHWTDQNPFPDPASWSTIDDPDLRLRRALSELYAFYARNERMLDNLTRDEPRVAALGPSMQGFREYLRGVRETLLIGRDRTTHRGSTVAAAIGHALAFSSWRSLVRDEGLDLRRAVSLMERVVRSAQ